MSASAFTQGRHCTICGKPGGMGCRYQLRLMKEDADQRGVKLNWHSYDLADAKAHSNCVSRERRRITTLAKARGEQ